MSDQTSLPGFAPPPDEEERRRHPLEHIFFALIPGPQIVGDALALRAGLMKSEQLHGTPRPGHLFHVTLCSLPAYGDSVAKDAYGKAALAAVAGLRHPQIQVTFDRTELFGGGAYVLTGHNPKVVSLIKTLGLLLRRIRISSRQMLAPHMTLLYAEGIPPRCSRCSR